MTEESLDEAQLLHDKKRALEYCPRDQQRAMGVALSLLVEFSRRHAPELRVMPTAELDQESIGIILCKRDAVLWKIYARRARLEVLIRTQKGLPDVEYDEFVRLWRQIPGMVNTLTTKREVAAIRTSALQEQETWSALEACLEWACGLEAKP